MCSNAKGDDNNTKTVFIFNSRYDCLLFTKDETPKKLLSLRIKNPLIEHTVPHNMSINACSGEILTLQTYYTPLSGY